MESTLIRDVYRSLSRPKSVSDPTESNKGFPEFYPLEQDQNIMEDGWTEDGWLDKWTEDDRLIGWMGRRGMVG